MCTFIVSDKIEFHCMYNTEVFVFVTLSADIKYSNTLPNCSPIVRVSATQILWVNKVMYMWETRYIKYVPSTYLHTLPWWTIHIWWEKGKLCNVFFYIVYLDHPWWLYISETISMGFGFDAIWIQILKLKIYRRTPSALIAFLCYTVKKLI